MKKSTMYWILCVIFGIAAVTLYSYGDTVGGNMMAAVVIGLSISNIIRNAMLKNGIKKDEMVKRISGMSSDIALCLSIISIGLLTVVLHFFPTLFDVFEVLAILLAVMLISKIALQMYYTKVKDEIGF
ncbi:DUF2178 domain-containing protein [Methanolobus vulcani]|uniref:DUF2178 domain-containing protein n=1 Tax=Methanolobus vulcani TaxID=38026 RepID=A0A7Z8KP38_9EURY|nr:DUF2178 domain-containing protein [Methanolobus vulcani]TQD26275.1 DUF2178 domain-containing protein [Methanolobus vulcani]